MSAIPNIGFLRQIRRSRYPRSAYRLNARRELRESSSSSGPQTGNRKVTLIERRLIS